MEPWMLNHLEDWLNTVYVAGDDALRNRTRRMVVDYLANDATDLGEDWHTIAKHAGVRDLYTI